MQPINPKAPPPQLLKAMMQLRAGDDRGALELVEAALPGASDRAPYLAVAGLAALRLREPDRAIPHLRALLALKPEDTASKANLANALIETDCTDEAMELVAGSSEPRLVRIQAYLRQRAGEAEAAEEGYRRAIAADPNDLSSWNNLGNLLAAKGDIDGAITAFERAISLAPADLPIYLNLADLLRQSERNEARLKVLIDASEIAPTDRRVLIELGLAQAQLDDFDAAIGTLERAIELHPDFSDAHIELGMIYESLNRIDDLAALNRRVDATSAPLEAAFLRAWEARRSGDFVRAAELAATIPETIHPMRRFHLIGGIADRLGNADAAFEAFERMNREALEASPPLFGKSYREQIEDDLARWTDAWAQGWTEATPDDDYRDPVFLVGFPRSGTTLLDTMLMGQPDLSVLEERPMMARIIKLLGDDDLPDLDTRRIGELRAAYFGLARDYGWDTGRWLVDKHPLNMSRVPAIRRLFPSARIIFAERHPYDVVLSCFMANFTVNLAMRSFTSLEEAAKTYDTVFRAWDRATALFEVEKRTVRYEELVIDPKAELKPVVEWLGLDWNPAVLEHTRTAKERGRVRTASYSQIGEQLYTRARGRWERYAAHLEPVIPILKPWAERMGYPTERA